MAVENKNTKVVLILSFLVAILSAYSAILGFYNKSLYNDVILTGVFKNSFIAGTISQDIITIISSILMLMGILLYMKLKDSRILMSIIGLLAYFLYGYATYVISALYTSIYIVYMVICALSLFGLILGLSGFRNEEINQLCLPKWFRISSGVFLSIIVFIFISKWTASIIPYTQSHTVPDFYAIFILDLCVVMPFFIFTIYMLIKNSKFGYVLLGVALLKTATLLLSVSIGSFIAPAYGTQDELSMIVTYCIVTIISLLLFIFYLIKLRSVID